MTLLTIVQGCSRIIPYSCMRCSNSCTDTPKKERRSLGLQEMKGESGQKQWEYNKRNIKKTLVYTLVGFDIWELVLQDLPKISFWSEEQPQGRAAGAAGCPAQTEERSSVTLTCLRGSQQWLTHWALYASKNSRWRRTGQIICSFRRNSWMKAKLVPWAELKVSIS